MWPQAMQPNYKVFVVSFLLSNAPEPTEAHMHAAFLDSIKCATSGRKVRGRLEVPAL
jgi:hypothetical protein